MQLKYVDTKEEIIAVNKKSKHIEPHLHNALEIVCVTSGTLELGVGQELYHMEKGDIGFVFPNVIHHYQVLTPGVNTVTYLIASPFTIAKFADIMQSMAPEYPIITAEKVESEVYRVINESSPNLCVHSSSSYVSPSMLPLSSGDLIEWSLVCHSTLSYQKFCDRHSNHYDHPEELHQSVE